MKQEGFWEVHVYDSEYELIVEYDETNNDHVKTIENLYRMMNNMNNIDELFGNMKSFIDFISLNRLKYYFKRVDD